MTLQECFKILELSPNAGPDDVRKAYRRLAKTWHPDRFSADSILRKTAEDNIKLINTAYARLNTYFTEHPVQRAAATGQSSVQSDSVRPDTVSPPPSMRSILSRLVRQFLNSISQPTERAAPRHRKNRPMKKRKARSSHQFTSQAKGKPSSPGAAAKAPPSGKRKSRRPRYEDYVPRKRSGSGRIDAIEPAQGPHRVSGVSRVRGIGRDR